MIWIALAWLGLVFAAIPAFVFLSNYSAFRRLPCAEVRLPDAGATRGPVSVLVPARNEESSIEACLQKVLASKGVELEVVVLDDQSEDQTAQIVRKVASDDARVRLESARPLPPGWCGKQHACAQLGELAKYDLFVFIDADVRMEPDALARIAGEFERSGVDLLSGFPRQRTVTLAEQLLIPLMHFVLLGFLSLRRMRNTTHPAFGAGCGQLFITSRSAYQTSGGHAGIRMSLHDGIKLPRLYRSKGLITDLFDASDIATCRMYDSVSEVWHGLKKNATEGVASAGLIVPVTLMLVCGQVLPFLLLVVALLERSGVAAVSGGALSGWTWLAILAACSLAWLPRLMASATYGQSLIGALLHPFAIMGFLAIQWSAFIGSFSKRPVSWKGRPYPAS